MRYSSSSSSSLQQKKARKREVQAFRVQVLAAAASVPLVWLCLFVTSLRLDGTLHFSWSVCFLVLFAVDFVIFSVLMKLMYDALTIRKRRARQSRLTHLGVATTIGALLLIEQWLVLAKITPPAHPVALGNQTAPPPPTAEQPTAVAIEMPWSIVALPLYAASAVAVAYASYLCPKRAFDENTRNDDDWLLQQCGCGGGSTMKMNGPRCCMQVLQCLIDYLSVTDVVAHSPPPPSPPQQPPPPLTPEPAAAAAFPLSRAVPDDDEVESIVTNIYSDTAVTPPALPPGDAWLSSPAVHYGVFGALLGSVWVFLFCVGLRLDGVILWSWYVFFAPLVLIDALIGALLVRYVYSLAHVPRSTERERYVIISVCACVIFALALIQEYIFISNVAVYTQRWLTALMPSYLIAAGLAAVYLAAMRGHLLDSLVKTGSAGARNVDDDDDDDDEEEMEEGAEDRDEAVLFRNSS